MNLEVDATLINEINDPIALAAHVYLQYFKNCCPFKISEKGEVNYLMQKFNIDDNTARRALDYLSKVTDK